MCWRRGIAPQIVNFSARQRWVVRVVTLPCRKRPQLPLNVWMDVPQPVWTFRRLAESLSPSVNPVAIFRVLPHCLSHCAYSHCREELYLHASRRLRDAHRTTYTVCTDLRQASYRNWGPDDCQSAAFLMRQLLALGSRLHARTPRLYCTNRCTSTSTNTNVTKTLK